ncbi:MAG TPA: hypothetical protein VGC10_09715 [Sphingomonas sp.]
MSTIPRIRRALPVLTGALLLTLGACNSQPENLVVGPPDDMKDQLANAKPVALPPAMLASKSYRCKDNSVAYVDWYADDKSAGIHAKKGDAPTIVKAPEPGKEMTADGGYALTGDAKGGSITITTPGKGKQSCDA